MYQNILVPTDGSDGAMAALEHGLELAELSGATVHALYAIDETESSGQIIGTDAGRVVERFREEGEEAVDAAAEKARAAGIDVETEVTEGSPHEVILDYVEEHDVDLIVMSTHGRSGVSRFLLGSVTEGVLRATDVPVLTIRRGTTDEAES